LYESQVKGASDIKRGSDSQEEDGKDKKKGCTVTKTVFLA
jgi:hypothetical protein